MYNADDANAVMLREKLFRRIFTEKIKFGHKILNKNVHISR